MADEKKLQHCQAGITRIPSFNPTSIYGNYSCEVVRKNGEVVPVKESSSSSSTISSTITTEKTPSALIANSTTMSSPTTTTSFKKPRIEEEGSSSNQQELFMNFSTFLRRPSMLLANNNCESNNNKEELPFPQKQCKSVDHNSNSNSNNKKKKRKVVDTGFCTNDPLIEYSSVCSLGASNNTDISSPKQELDDYSIYLSENNDEDIEDDVMMKEIKNARREGNYNNGVRRRKNAETHNLYERRRRDKINKKLRILKDLIPNCNKVDKASLLDDAIEYLKALKLHLQIMTMGTGLCMPPLMLPTSSPQHLMNTTSQLQHLMGFRHGINIPLCNIMPHQQFPSIPPMPLPPAAVGISNNNNNNNGVGMFGFPNQFLPMMTPNHPMSHAPFTTTTTTIHPMVGNNKINNDNIFTQAPLQTTNNVSAS
ncbi:hypothetical protein PIB30_016370 [Stylosanthes scabra]|uniref:BHLH domain-containing protein n=1 Tax=Stylosanthes scabra TaxID=79078 RepID=A0ABU6T914_9FABA|nr:hypothetical protein [Stylosanthes scabra]